MRGYVNSAWVQVSTNSKQQLEWSNKLHLRHCKYYHVANFKVTQGKQHQNSSYGYDLTNPPLHVKEKLWICNNALPLFYIKTQNKIRQYSAPR